ncbi:porin [Paracoccus pacificus]|uniref:Porin n=1 Tax=Paracoccus pacificus TaxID=1463598 RepID=A0ABW4R2T9_9RHOB
MKKVLFASTALVMMTAGVASAEVALSGDGRMGIVYDGNDAQFSSRIRARFTMTGESDAGLSFGGTFRVDQENYSSNSFRSAARGTAGAVWISGTYGKLSMGDTVSASEAAVGDLYDIGYTEGSFAGDYEEISYLTGDGENLNQGPNILYEYSYNNFKFYASASDGSDNLVCGVGAVTGSDAVCNVPGDDDKSDTAWSLAAAYDAGNYNVGLGYARHGDAKEIVLGGEATFNQFSVKAVIADYKDRGWAPGYDFDKTYGISAKYAANALTVKANWRRDEVNSLIAGVDDESFDSYGIGADYDLGGGATVAGGISKSDYIDDTVADFGIKFKF